MVATVRARRSTSAGRGRKYCTGGVFFSGRVDGMTTGLADWEHAERVRVAGGGGTG
ncbi:MAG: hypothetical protein WBQ04_20885 [Candidatus Acidiferrales bacterium]